MVEVSIIIVCMNKPENLGPCLGSIKKYTSVSYEVFVVAYLFTHDNLRKLKDEYPWVRIIESNEIRGFAENNNLALRQATGKYCFVLNDDTEMKMPVVDMLYNTIGELPDNVAVISPETDYPDGTVQFCGRPKATVWTKLMGSIHVYNEKKDTLYSNKKGTFKSYNILGAAFMIRRDIFLKVGLFNEYYFFAPEDIALSTLLNKSGYECWVNSAAKLIHYEGLTGRSIKGVSKIQTATKPAQAKGEAYFYAGEKDSGILYFLLCLWEFSLGMILFPLHALKGAIKKKPNYDTNLARAIKNTCGAIFNNDTPKQTFVKYYKQLK